MVVHFGIGETLSRGADGGFRNVESGGAKTPRRELLGVVAQTAANNQRRLPFRLLWMRHPKTDQQRSGMIVRPRNAALPFLSFAIERFEPAGGIAFAVEFGRYFARARAIFHPAIVSRGAN